MKFEVSVIIPMYNSANDIVRSLNSVARQTLRVKEIIVVNDGSTDNSADIVEDWRKKNPNMQLVLINQSNGGVSKARNTGLKNAVGNWIALLDSDDEWHNNKLQVQYETIMANPNIDFIACNPIREKIERFFWKKFEYLNKITVSNLIFKNYFQPSTVVFKQEIVNVIGYFDETQRYAEEGNYFMRIAHQYNCYLLNIRLINYGYDKEGFGHSGLSGNVVEMEKGELKNLKFVYSNNYINGFQYITALLFSLIKFAIRIIKVKLKNSNATN